MRLMDAMDRGSVRYYAKMDGAYLNTSVLKPVILLAVITGDKV